MYKLEDCIKTINEYFGTDYRVVDVVPDFGLGKPHRFPKPSIHRLEEIMRFIWRIQEEGFIVNIQDLRTLDKYPEYRIWFNLMENMVECPFGQISQGAAGGYLEGSSLECCLLYSISEWCKFNKYIKQNVTWRRIRDKDVKYTGCIDVDGEEIVLYRIHDLDYLHIEYVELDGNVCMVEMPENFMMNEVKIAAESMMYGCITSIAKNPSKFNLKNK